MEPHRAKPFGADAQVTTPDRLFFLPIYVGITPQESAGLPFPSGLGGKQARQRGRGR